MRRILLLLSLSLLTLCAYIAAFFIANRPLKFELIGPEIVFIRAGEVYEDPGVDYLDPDDVIHIESTLDPTRYGTYTITYTLEKAEQTHQLIRTVIVLDTTYPTLTLKGDALVRYKVGSTYQEPGYSAFDPQDGDLSTQVLVETDLNMLLAGFYTITYRVKDLSGFMVETTRQVEVYSGHGDTTLYLTFDDGPSEVTSEILDILKEYGIKATFFVMRSNRSHYPLIKRAYDEGHTIGLHTYSHEYERIYNSVSAYLSDLKKISAHVQTQIGIESKIIRFPGGSSLDRVSSGFMSDLIDEVHSLGYEYYDWDVDSGDGKPYSASKMFTEIMRKVGGEPEYTLLFHDGPGHGTTADALPAILDELIAQGYRFAAITNETKPVHHRD